MQPHPDQKFGCVTYAQHGDDLMILNIFDLLGQKKFTWLDIGAHHPTIISNTRLAYERGCRGVNVDANRELEAAFLKDRPHDVNVFGVAVGPDDGVAKFHKYSPTSGRNTISETEVKSLEGVLSVKETVEIPVVTINRIVTQYCSGIWPDLLLIDAEGEDYGILKSAEWTVGPIQIEGRWTDDVNSPKVICVETRLKDTSKTIQLLAARGFVVFCRTGENLFFLQKSLYKKVMGL